MSGTLPRPGEVEIETGDRVVACLPSARSALHDELRTRGFTVEHVELLPCVREIVRPDEKIIVLCDTSPDDWLRELADLVVARPGVQPVLLSQLDSADEFLAALAAGVAGFCSLDAPASAVARTISAVDRTGTAIPRRMVPLLVQHVRHGRNRVVHVGEAVIDVTEREWATLQLLMQRRSTREMAEALFVSVGTVRCHISTLLKKIGAADREDAVTLVERGRRYSES